MWIFERVIGGLVDIVMFLIGLSATIIVLYVLFTKMEVILTIISKCLRNL